MSQFFIIRCNNCDSIFWILAAKYVILICNCKPVGMPIVENEGPDGYVTWIFRTIIFLSMNLNSWKKIYFWVIFFHRIYNGLNAEQIAAYMADKGVHLSILSPRKIPGKNYVDILLLLVWMCSYFNVCELIAALINLFDKSGGDTSTQKLYVRDSRHLVLLNGYALQERPSSPPAVTPTKAENGPATPQTPSVQVTAQVQVAPTPPSLPPQPPPAASVPTVTSAPLAPSMSSAPQLVTNTPPFRGGPGGPDMRPQRPPGMMAGQQRGPVPGQGPMTSMASMPTPMGQMSQQQMPPTSQNMMQPQHSMQQQSSGMMNPSQQMMSQMNQVSATNSLTGPQMSSQINQPIMNTPVSSMSQPTSANQPHSSALASSLNPGLNSQSPMGQGSTSVSSQLSQQMQQGNVGMNPQQQQGNIGISTSQMGPGSMMNPSQTVTSQMGGPMGQQQQMNPQMMQQGQGPMNPQGSQQPNQLNQLLNNQGAQSNPMMTNPQRWTMQQRLLLVSTCW